MFNMQLIYKRIWPSVDVGLGLRRWPSVCS